MEPKTLKLFSLELGLRISTFLALVILGSSCSLSNNFYGHDVLESTGGEEAMLYAGISTGMQPVTSLADDDSTIIFNDKIEVVPANLVFGGQIGILGHIDLRFAVHLAGFAGGGGRIGAQYNFFERSSDFNLALGADVGGAVAFDFTTDSLDVNYVPNGVPSSFAADFYMPFLFRFENNTKLVVTPRFTMNVFEVRYNVSYDDSFSHNQNVLSLSLGYKTKWIYYEASIMQVRNDYLPNFGIVYIF